MNAPAKPFSGDLVEAMRGSQDVAVYRAKERSQRIQAYVAESFARRVLNLGRLWSILDRANDTGETDEKKKKDALKEWTESEILKRLLEVAADAAWAEIDGGEPKTEEEWARIEERLLKRAKAASKK